jgi:hypothetical protein
MKSLVAAAAVFGMLAGTAHAADDTPRVFKPAGQWVADYGDDYCRLSRNFSDGGDQISLAFDRIQPGIDTRMILLGDSIKLYRGTVNLGFRFLPANEERSGSLLRSEAQGGKQYLLVTPVLIGAAPAPGTPAGQPAAYDRAKELEFAGNVQGLMLTEGTLTPIEIDTGAIKPVIAALQACTDDLVKSWSVDPAKQKAATRLAAPDGDTAKWIPDNTISFADFGKLSGEMNQVRLLVDETGKPTDCKIHFPSLDQSTNDRLCKALMSNARFKPALDAGRMPFASYYVASPLALLPPPPGSKHR